MDYAFTMLVIREAGLLGELGLVVSRTSRPRSEERDGGVDRVDGGECMQSRNESGPVDGGMIQEGIERNSE